MTATFVKAPHHMQVKLASKNGFDIRVADDNTHYVLVNIDAATTIYGTDAAQLIKDGSAQRMLLAEYPMLSLKQDLKTFEWTISKGRKALATASCLEDAKDLALEALADMEQKPAKAVKPAKADKPAKPVKAKVAASDEDGDEEAEGDEDNAVADEGDEGDEDGEEETESKSIVKRKYKKLYRPNKDTNGDGLSDQIRDHVSLENDAGDKRIDVAALKRFAIANNVWQASYALLNVGQMKMNITNRLRGLIRAGARDGKEYDIKWS